MSDTEIDNDEYEEVELSEEEEKLMKEELARLNKITSLLWMRALHSGWQTTPHTVEGVRKFDLVNRARIVRNVMPTMGFNTAPRRPIFGGLKVSSVNRPIVQVSTNQRFPTPQRRYNNRGVVNFRKFMSL